MTGACGRCGTALQPDWRLCPRCGAPARPDPAGGWPVLDPGRAVGAAIVLMGALVEVVGTGIDWAGPGDLRAAEIASDVVAPGVALVLAGLGWWRPFARAAAGSAVVLAGFLIVHDGIGHVAVGTSKGAAGLWAHVPAAVLLLTGGLVLGGTSGPGWGGGRRRGPWAAATGATAMVWSLAQALPAYRVVRVLAGPGDGPGLTATDCCGLYEATPWSRATVVLLGLLLVAAVVLAPTVLPGAAAGAVVATVGVLYSGHSLAWLIWILGPKDLGHAEVVVHEANLGGVLALAATVVLVLLGLALALRSRALARRAAAAPTAGSGADGSSGVGSGVVGSGAAVGRLPDAGGPVPVPADNGYPEQPRWTAAVDVAGSLPVPTSTPAIGSPTSPSTSPPMSPPVPPSTPPSPPPSPPPVPVRGQVGAAVLTVGAVVLHVTLEVLPWGTAPLAAQAVSLAFHLPALVLVLVVAVAAWTPGGRAWAGPAGTLVGVWLLVRALTQVVSAPPGLSGLWRWTALVTALLLVTGGVLVTSVTGFRPGGGLRAVAWTAAAVVAAVSWFVASWLPWFRMTSTATVAGVTWPESGTDTLVRDCCRAFAAQAGQSRGLVVGYVGLVVVAAVVLSLVRRADVAGLLVATLGVLYLADSLWFVQWLLQSPADLEAAGNTRDAIRDQGLREVTTGLPAGWAALVAALALVGIGLARHAVATRSATARTPTPSATRTAAVTGTGAAGEPLAP